MVEYRDIPGYPGYRAGSDGSIWSMWRTRPGGRFLKDWRQCKLSPGSRGYLRVNLTPLIGKAQTFRVHRLVLISFVGACPEGMEARHLNGVKDDNCIENLVWGTPEENRQDNHRLGVYQRGEMHPARRRKALLNASVN